MSDDLRRIDPRAVVPPERPALRIVPPQPECQECGDRHWIEIEGDERRVRRCRCRDPRQTDAALRHALRRSGLEDDEIESATTPWDHDVQPYPGGVAEWCSGLAAGGTPDVVSWVLFGAPGRGKSKVAAMGAAAYLRAGGRGLVWINVPEAIAAVMAERRADPPRNDVERRIMEARLLVLDELGAERQGNRAAVVDEWIAYRYRRRLPMLGTTNAEDLDELGDGRIASRLDGGEQLEMVSDVDYRAYRSNR